jgi:hypothetical protein
MLKLWAIAGLSMIAIVIPIQGGAALGIRGRDPVADSVIGDGAAIACGIGFADLTVESVVSLVGTMTERVSGSD